jgi:hypothetical protein
VIAPGGDGLVEQAGQVVDAIRVARRPIRDEHEPTRLEHPQAGPLGDGCRRGHIEKGDIGTIRILDRETRFEVRTELAAEFDRNARRPDRKDPNIRFLPVED